MITAQMQEQNQHIGEEIDLASFCAPIGTSVSKTTRMSGVLSVINTKKNGKRITLSSELMARLNDPETVQFAFREDQIAIAEKLPNNETSFGLKRCGSRSIVYAAKLVEEVTQRFQIDFCERTTYTFQDVIFTEFDGYPVAVVSVR
ncbi:hypothetical protein GJ688_11575 [Heliobacillus mobilis]|uniref:Uncharacterized protein n=1 Tax=Heliobacterium mobile TaxID=28064 RepID=A0A6I3SMP8_HELMO|nr:hypothetical protein [Heliobacterium mobile]MTV49617.1 hypothetical protein [Heliobacterium mobile]